MNPMPVLIDLNTAFKKPDGYYFNNHDATIEIWNSISLLNMMRMYSKIMDVWQRWQVRSTNRRIFSAILTISSITAVIQLVTIAKEILVASRFGTGDALDAFLIALMIPTLCIGVVASSFNTALIPTFIRVRERDGLEAAQRLFSSTTVFSVSLLTVISILMAVAVPYIFTFIASGFGSEKLLLTRHLFYSLLPIIVLYGVSTTWSAILNAGERFMLTSVVPVLRPLAIVVFLYTTYETLGIYAMSIGTITGLVCELCLLGRSLRHRGIRIFPRWYGFSDDLRVVLHQYLPLSASVFFMSSTAVIDQSFAANLQPGSVSVLNYGYKIVSLILTLSATALGTAVLPHFSRMIAGGDWDGFRHTLKTYIKLIVFGSIPVIAVLFNFSEPLVALAFKRGAFTSADAALAGKIQAIYALQIPVYILCIIFVRAISAMNLNKVLMWTGVICLISTVSFDYLFVKIFGVTGIAISGCFVYSIGLLFLSTMLWRYIRKRPSISV